MVWQEYYFFYDEGEGEEVAFYRWKHGTGGGGGGILDRRGSKAGHDHAWHIRRSLAERIGSIDPSASSCRSALASFLFR